MVCETCQHWVQCCVPFSPHLLRYTPTSTVGPTLHPTSTTPTTFCTLRDNNHRHGHTSLPEKLFLFAGASLKELHCSFYFFFFSFKLLGNEFQRPYVGNGGIFIIAVFAVFVNNECRGQVCRAAAHKTSNCHHLWEKKHSYSFFIHAGFLVVYRLCETLRQPAWCCPVGR